jgi:hypothetical protein
MRGVALPLSRKVCRVAGRRIAVARDEQALPVRSEVARSPGAAARRLTSSVEIIRVRGPDAVRLAEVQIEVIREVLAWAVTQHNQDMHTDQEEDRAA